MKQSKLVSFFKSNKVIGNDNSIVEVTKTVSNENSILLLEKNTIKDELHSNVPEIKKDVVVDISVNSVSIDTIINTVMNSSSTRTLELSDYEKQRLENIRRNQQFLSSLGFESVDHTMPTVNVCTNKRKITGSSSNAPKQLKRVELPTRQSSRHKPVVSYSEEEHYANVTIEETDSNHNYDTMTDSDAPVDYDDSNVYRYVMSASTSCSTYESAQCMNNAHKPAGQQIKSLNLIPGTEASCGDLNAVYSLEFHPYYQSLLLAAGKGGQVVLFNMHSGRSDPVTNNIGGDKNEEATTSNSGSSGSSTVLASYRAHTRWISSAKFVTSSYYDNDTERTDDSQVDTSPLLVLTASDDASVKLWDLSKVQRTNHSSSNSSNKYQLLSTNTSLHDKGIFCMDVVNTSTGTQILTGSKDKTICLSNLLPNSTSLIRDRVFEFHSKVVKTVSWNHSSSSLSGEGCIFASGGQDSNVCIKDIRSHSADADISIHDAHDGVVHTVCWAPSSSSSSSSSSAEPVLISSNEVIGSSTREYLLMTAGFDRSIKLYDVRMTTSSKTAIPLYTYTGHVSSNIKKQSNIVSPVFVDYDTVLTPGDGTNLLSLYSTYNGKTISRGEVVYDGMCLTPTAVTCSNVDSRALRIAVVCKPAILYLLEPVYF